MAELSRLWAGKVYGTNTGNLSLVIESNAGRLSGKLRMMDDRFGLSVFEVSGNFDGSKIEVAGDPIQGAPDVQLGAIVVSGFLAPNGELRGEWSSKIGTGGTFLLLPHDGAERDQKDLNLPPERLHSANKSLGALRLYTDDLADLINFLARDFQQGRVTVTYRDQGRDITRYAEDFLGDLSAIGEIRYLRLFIQQSDIYNVNRTASVELSAEGVNIVGVQGVHETWVVGKTHSIYNHLKQKQSLITTGLNKFGININTFIAAGIIAALPDLEFIKRLVLIAVGMSLIYFIAAVHRKLIPNFVVYASPAKPSLFRRMMPQVGSWLIAATSGIVAAVAYGLLKGEINLSIFSIR